MCGLPVMSAVVHAHITSGSVLITQLFLILSPVTLSASIVTVRQDTPVKTDLMIV